MGLTRALAVAATLLPLACGGADGSADVADTTHVAEVGLPTVHAGELTVSRIVAPAPVADGPMALYLEVANGGAAADTLLGATVAGASASLHETTDGSMRPVARLPIPAGATVALRPGGLHGMIEGLAAAPAPGDTLRATLRFARAGEVAIAAPVVAYAELERRLGAGAHAGH
jgi:copper(I)-binding protein